MHKCCWLRQWSSQLFLNFRLLGRHTGSNTKSRTLFLLNHFPIFHTCQPHFYRTVLFRMRRVKMSAGTVEIPDHRALLACGPDHGWWAAELFGMGFPVVCGCRQPWRLLGWGQGWPPWVVQAAGGRLSVFLGHPFPQLISAPDAPETRFHLYINWWVMYHLKRACNGCRFPCCTSSDPFSGLVSISQLIAEQTLRIPTHLKTFLPVHWHCQCIKLKLHLFLFLLGGWVFNAACGLLGSEVNSAIHPR